jgi:hypothetical protein
MAQKKRKPGDSQVADAPADLADPAYELELTFIADCFRQDKGLGNTVASLLRNDSLKGILNARREVKEPKKVVEKRMHGILKGPILDAALRAMSPVFGDLLDTPDVMVGITEDQQQGWLCFSLNVGMETAIAFDEYHPLFAIQSTCFQLFAARYQQMGKRCDQWAAENTIDGGKVVGNLVAAETSVDIPFQTNMHGSIELENPYDMEGGFSQPPRICLVYDSFLTELPDLLVPATDGPEKLPNIIAEVIEVIDDPMSDDTSAVGGATVAGAKTVAGANSLRRL